MASATAAGSAYSTHGEPMIPFYIFYSMFGFQRTGDSIWAMADQLARGFLIGATAGRTTLTGEGLQHADGHSPLLAATNPAVVHYDPAFAYEVAHIMQDGLRRMYGSTDEHPHGEDVIYYLTVYNEPIEQPERAGRPRRRGPAAGHLPRRRRRPAAWPRTRRASSCSPRASASRGSQRPSSCWPTTGAWRPTSGRSPRGTSWPARRRHRGVEPASTRSRSHGRRTSPTKLQDAAGPVVAVSDYMRAVPQQIARWVPQRLPRARHRRLRLRRHPPGRAALLPDRRRVGGRAGAVRRSPKRGEIKPRRGQEAFDHYRIDDPTAVSDVKQEGGDA